MTKSIADLKLPDNIRSQRLFLRAPQIGDAKAMQELANNKNIHAVLARLPHPYSIEHALDFINNLARRSDEHAYAIINENVDFIGIISLHPTLNLAPELGYWLGEPYWGKGYATEAVKAVLSAVSEIGVADVFARSITSNTGSINVLKKVGFSETSKGIDDCGHHKGVCVTKLQWQGER